MAFRAVVATWNRGQIALVAEAMRGNTRNQLMALPAPPWAERRAAVTAELDRLAAGPGRRRMPELRVIELLMAGGIAAGLVAGGLV